MNLISLAGAVAGLFNGTVTVGGVDLDGLEIPDKLNWGGGQHTVVHKQPGGARVVDVMGSDDADIKWSGYFAGPSANYRARTLDAIRQAGKAVTLSWPGFQRQVVVSEFTCSSERNGYLLPYSITCVVVPAPAAASGLSLLGQITNDIGDAIGVPTLVQTITPVLQQAQTALRSVQAVMPVVGVLTGGSPRFATLSGAVTGAQGIVGIGVAATESSMAGTLAGAAATGTPLGTTAPTSAIAALGNALSQSQSLAGLVAMGSLVGRVAKNLTSAVS